MTFLPFFVFVPVRDCCWGCDPFLVPTTNKTQAAQSLADSLGVPYIECSAKTGENVAEVFHILLKEIEKDDGLLAETGDGGCHIL